MSAPGLWINEHDFLEFGATSLAELLGEVAVPPESWGWLGLLPDPDPVLRERGDDIKVLEDLTAAPNVASVKTFLTIRRAKREPGVPISVPEK